MMEYKRLTSKDKNGFYHYNCTKKEKKDCCLWESCGECYGSKVLRKLGEIEDKIESGLMVELPCKVGDTCYLVFRVLGDMFGFGYKIKKVTIDNIHYIGNNEFLTETGEYSKYMVKFGEDIFTTREEAEVRLKELQNG